ncbi:hypothetical protein Ctob_007982 [Chrysochromulina tobinii]|uniref:Uncharacterized protein n=1 Tax=Chrysochromulina tobinii TaxID=1460289 RepID=A0A0M0K5P9_9EUKA|nr:hypothetical protein Ctob_007982 [Chrysochromulina tobinii]|eukprot:KOO34186.1 hypothetical protein Ctob_007982 [Chrysochromulina sp. CCMP291]
MRLQSLRTWTASIGRWPRAWESRTWRARCAKARAALRTSSSRRRGA